MPRAFASDDADDLIQAERDVSRVLADLDLDFTSLAVVSNIFRVATAVRNHMERSVLAPHRLSWSAFVVLFVLRIWGPQDTRTLAAEAGITPGTLTGVLITLESRGMVRRRTRTDDRRRVTVRATAKGRRAIDEIMPAFNRHEVLVTQDLTERQRSQLARALRTVLRTVERVDA